MRFFSIDRYKGFELIKVKIFQEEGSYWKIRKNGKTIDRALTRDNARRQVNRILQLDNAPVS